MTTMVDQITARSYEVRERISGIQITLPAALSAAGQYVIIMDNADNLVKMSRNGGNFIPLVVGLAGVCTLDAAYDGVTGVGNGRAVIVDSGAITLTNNAANNNGVLEINKTPVGAQAGEGITVGFGVNATGIAVNIAQLGSNIGAQVAMGAAAISAGINVTHAGLGANVVGVNIAMTPNAAGQARGLTVTMGLNTNGNGYAALFDWRSVAGTVANSAVVGITTGAVINPTAGPLVMLAIDHAAAITLGAPLTGMVIDLTTNVVPGNFIIQGININIPATAEVAASAAIFATIPAVDEDTIPYFRLGGCAVYFSAGAPDNAEGDNGDYYFMNNAALATTAIYVKLAGTWTAV